MTSDSEVVIQTAIVIETLLQRYAFLYDVDFVWNVMANQISSFRRKGRQ